MTLATEFNNVNSGTFTYFDNLRKVVKLCGHARSNLSAGSATYRMRS